MPPAIFHRLVPALLSMVRFGVGLLFFQHGAEKLWGFAGARTVGVHLSLIGMAGPIEGVGGILIVLGLFTRAAAFILCGEMAVAYFTWVRFGFWPINNGGEEAAIFCFLFLWLSPRARDLGALDSVIAPLRARPLPARVADAVSSWEDYARAVLRIVLASNISLHGFRHLFGAFPQLGGRRGAPIALDVLPPAFGVLEIAGGFLLIVGLFTSFTALLLCAELLAAYFYAAVPRSVWPIRNGGNHVLLYFLAFLYIATAGPGRWSLDALRKVAAHWRPAVTCI